MVGTRWARQFELDHSVRLWREFGAFKFFMRHCALVLPSGISENTHKRTVNNIKIPINNNATWQVLRLTRKDSVSSCIKGPPTFHLFL